MSSLSHKSEGYLRCPCQFYCHRVRSCTPRTKIDFSYEPPALTCWRMFIGVSVYVHMCAVRRSLSILPSLSEARTRHLSNKGNTAVLAPQSIATSELGRETAQGGFNVHASDLLAEKLNCDICSFDPPSILLRGAPPPREVIA